MALPNTPRPTVTVLAKPTPSPATPFVNQAVSLTNLFNATSALTPATHGAVAVGTPLPKATGTKPPPPQNIFTEVGGAIGGAANAVGGAVTTAANATGKAIGTAAVDTANFVGKHPVDLLEAVGGAVLTAIPATTALGIGLDVTAGISIAKDITGDVTTAQQHPNTTATKTTTPQSAAPVTVRPQVPTEEPEPAPTRSAPTGAATVAGAVTSLLNPSAPNTPRVQTDWVQAFLNSFRT